MDTIDTTSSHELSESEQFHVTFESNVRELMEPVRTALIECDPSTGRPEEIIAQMLMNFLGGVDFPHFDSEQVHDSSSGSFTTEQKAFMVRMADWMGPDWAQALYHAAVFITKVA